MELYHPQCGSRKQCEPVACARRTGWRKVVAVDLDDPVVYTEMANECGWRRVRVDV